ncbi:hypothetical protein FM103_14925 [Corynebacterium xerosis]|nr:hypothetical protein FM103_14925 [Corynebacterium xerosis]
MGRRTPLGVGQRVPGEGGQPGREATADAAGGRPGSRGGV